MGQFSVAQVGQFSVAIDTIERAIEKGVRKALEEGLENRRTETRTPEFSREK